MSVNLKVSHATITSTTTFRGTVFHVFHTIQNGQILSCTWSTCHDMHVKYSNFQRGSRNTACAPEWFLSLMHPHVTTKCKFFLKCFATESTSMSHGGCVNFAGMFALHMNHQLSCVFKSLPTMFTSHWPCIIVFPFVDLPISNCPCHTSTQTHKQNVQQPTLPT